MANELRTEDSVDQPRRNLALAILGSLAGAGVLSACNDESPRSPGAPDGESGGVDHQSQALVVGVQGYDTAQNLASVAGSAGALAVVSGAFNADDGGGGTLTFEASAPTSGTPVGSMIIPSGSGHWRRNWRLGQELNLSWFGVAADGTDQSARFNEAIDWYKDELLAYTLARFGSGGYQDYVIPMYLPGAPRAYTITSPIDIPSGNRYLVRIRGDGHFTSDNAPFNHYTWNNDFVVGGSVIRAVGDFETFNFGGVYCYLDLTDLGVGRANGDNRACLRARESGGGDGNVVIRCNRTFTFNGLVGYWWDSAVSNYGNHDVVARGCETGIQLGSLGSGSGCWDHEIIGFRVEGCNRGLSLHAGASVTMMRGLIQGNEIGIHAPNNWGLATSRISDVHMESNGEAYQFGAPAYASHLHMQDIRQAGAITGTLTVPLGVSFERTNFNELDWERSYGPNRATQDLRAIGLYGVTNTSVDFSNGRKQVIGSLPSTRNPTPAGNVTIDAFYEGNFVCLDNIAGNINIQAPTRAPQGYVMKVRLRQDPTGSHAVAFTGFATGTARYSNSGNVGYSEGWLELAFDDSNQWSVMSWSGWA